MSAGRAGPGGECGRGARATGTGQRHWSAIGEETFAGGMWLLYALFRIGGRLPFRLVLWPVVTWYWAIHRPAREASLEYLQRLQASTNALGHAPGWRDTLRHFLSFAETILDKMLAVGGRYKLDTIRFAGREPIEQMVRSQQGGLLVTAHMGCLEMCQASADATPGLKLTVLVHTVHAEQFNRMLDRLSPGRGISLMQVTEITPATAVLLSERVERGEFVAIAGDRVPIVAGRACAVQVPFLGHDAPFPTGAYMLASLLKCPLLRWAASARAIRTKWCSSSWPSAWCCRAPTASGPAPATRPSSPAAWSACWRARPTNGSISFPSGINPERSPLAQGREA